MLVHRAHVPTHPLKALHRLVGAAQIANLSYSQVLLLIGQTTLHVESAVLLFPLCAR